MKNRWSLKGQNKGASLLAVLVALVFVGIIAVIIMNITITNIQMREIEESGKENFYSAESVMDDLTAGLNNVAAGAMQNAYTKILADYRTIMVTGTDIQDSFTRSYLDELEKVFWDGDTAERKDKRKTYDPGSVEKVVYVMGKYKEQPLLDSFSESANQSCLVFDTLHTDQYTYTIDFEEGLFTLENVEIVYTDANGYETSIKTDMVFHTPVLNFDGSNMIKNYMKYSLIADDKIEISAGPIEIDGNAYAGVGGVVSSYPGEAVMKGDTIVTRGDIKIGAGTSVTIGNGTSRIWAENVETTGKGDASTLVLNGNSYIADDLTLNGKNSTVTLYGNYYGYNFQDKYDAVRTTTDASFSSAMMVNAKECRLDLSNLNYLLLSGRTYISRGSKENIENNDIMLGESISVRSNQLAYYVPSAYLDLTDESNVCFTATGASDFANSISSDMGDIMPYLNSSKPIVTYCFNDGVNTTKRYYLNFASEQKANDFFAVYYSKKESLLTSNAETYIGNETAADNNGIILDNGTLYTLKGDIMYMEGDRQPIQEKKITISGNEWEPGTSGTDDGIYWAFADRLAINYKCLQLYLEDSHTSVTSDNVRFEDASTGKIDKSIEPLMENLLDVAAIEHDYPAAGGVTGGCEQIVQTYSATSKQVVVVIHNEGRERYEVNPTFTEGIIIATGDVLVKGNFKGMIIAGGTISFASGAHVSSDELMVSQLFKEDIASGTPVFAKYFKDYGTLSKSVIGVVQIDEYLTYDNWTKNGN